MSNNKEKEFIKKHKPLTKAEIKKRFQNMKQAKKDLTTNAAELEQNLKKFNEITDPMIDPETDKVLCWIRRPTTDELEDMIPTEMLQYRDSPEDVPQEIREKYKDFQFEMMENLITNPKKEAAWWKKNANLVFQQLFQMHLQGVMEDLGISAENF